MAARARAQQPAMPVIGFLVQRIARSVRARRARIPPGPERSRLCRGPERGDRISLGRRPKRSIAGIGSRSGSSPGDRDCRDQRSCGPGGKGGDHDDTDRLSDSGLDPVEVGLVASLNRPGGNLTGVTTLNVEVGPKRLELLRELVPTATIVALLVNPTSPTLPRPCRERCRRRPAPSGCSSMSCMRAPNATSIRSSQPWSNCEPARS